MTDRKALAKECLRIEKAGGSVRDYLRGLGFVSPWGTWFNLQREILHRGPMNITDGIGEKKGVEKMGKIREEKVHKRRRADNLEVILAAIRAEEDPVEALGKIGYLEPAQIYTDTKAWAKQNAPEKYAELPQNLQTWRKRIREAEAQEMTAEEIRAEEEEEITEGINREGFRATGIRTAYGEFRISSNGYFFFGSPENDEIEMPVERWREFIQDIPRVLRIMGVEL